MSPAVRPGLQRAAADTEAARQRGQGLPLADRPPASAWAATSVVDLDRAESLPCPVPARPGRVAAIPPRRIATQSPAGWPSDSRGTATAAGLLPRAPPARRLRRSLLRPRPLRSERQKVAS